MSTGMIFDIKEFAVHDGPGIRETVFLKGCPLNCEWCHNPEGLSSHQELMVSKSQCINCGKCSSVCENKKCIACGKCVDLCPLNLRKIIGKKVNANQLAIELLKNRDFLERNGGGVTISGGEPLAQPGFLLELLSNLQEIHTTIDTSGYALLKVFKKVVSLADLILYDLKHTDSDVHKRVTGVDNKLILKNLHYLVESRKPFILRLPLVPGINDDRENLSKVVEMIKDADSLIRVDILPYQKIAGAKYSMLAKEYCPSFSAEEKPEVFEDIFKEHNINYNIKGVYKND